MDKQCLGEGFQTRADGAHSISLLRQVHLGEGNSDLEPGRQCASVYHHGYIWHQG